MPTQRSIGLFTALVVGAAATLSFAPAAYAAVPEPILHYSFDDLGAVGASAPAGATIADAAGTRPGAVIGAGATAVAGPSGGTDRALRLPGGASTSSAAFVNIPTGLLSSAGDVTLSAWVNWAGGQTCTWPFALGSSSSNYLFFTPSCGGNLIGAVRASSETRAAGSGPLSTGWNHIAVSLRSGQSISTFVNGQQIATSATTATGAAAFGTSSFSGYLGKSFFSADPNFAGAIDDFRVYTAAFTAAEIAEIGHGTYQSIAEADGATGVDLGDTSAVISSLTLPTVGASGSRIAWSSSDPRVLSGSGVVTRPAAGNPDAEVTLTPTYTFGDASIVGAAIEITVPAVSDSELAELFSSQYLIDSVVASGLRLPDLGAVDVEYSSDDTDVVISEDGVIENLTDAAVDAAISVRLAVGGDVQLKTFSVKVLPESSAHRLLGYQRTPLAAQLYDADLAYSLHLALADADGPFEALHDNTGVAFAQGIQVADHLHDTTSFRSPWMFHRGDGGYGVVGVLANTAGAPLPSHAGRLVYFESDDMRQFTQVGYLAVDSTAVTAPRAAWDSSAQRYVLSWTTASGPRTVFADSLSDVATGAASLSTPAASGALALGAAVTTTIPGAIPGNVLTIDADTARALEIRFGRIANTTLSIDDELTTAAGAPLALDDVRATLGYSDGTKVEYEVEWDAEALAAVDFDTPGEYTVSGDLRDQRNIFPLATQRADPTVIRWDGKYVMVSTWDVNNAASTGIPLRVADTIAGLATAPEVRIVTNAQTATDGARMAGCFWAPDILVVDGELQIFFAPCYGSATWSQVVSSVTKLRAGGDVSNPADWSQPQKVTQADGTPLRLDAAHPGISLDMSYFQDPATGTEYAVWSERYINSPHPGGTGSGNGDAEMWIATYDPDAVRLTSAPVLLNQANAGWEQNNADVVEGAFFIVRDGTIWMSYSASMVDATYAVGLMQADVGADLLDLDSWTEWSAPVVKSDPARNEYGPGHSGFFVDEYGDDYFIYHAKSTLTGTRDAGVRKVFWASDGQPILDMTDDERIAPENRGVSITITVEDDADTLDVLASTALRCVAGKVVVVVTTQNQGDAPVSLAVQSTFGSKSVPALAPGRATSVAFTTRAPAIGEGSVQVTATDENTGATVDLDPAYSSTTCS